MLDFYPHTLSALPRRILITRIDLANVVSFWWLTLHSITFECYRFSFFVYRIPLRTVYDFVYSVEWNEVVVPMMLNLPMNACESATMSSRSDVWSTGERNV